MVLKIKEAIKRFNSTKKKTAKRLTQQDLGVAILPEMSVRVAGWYVSRWAGGEDYGKLKPEHVVAICKECKVDPNFLFGFKK